MQRTDTELAALREVLELDALGPHVVAVGGGHGLAQALGAVRSYAARIDAVVTVADDGGSSGRLAPAMDIPPPGDIRKCLLALTPDDSTWRRLYDYRFETSDVGGHSLGNLIIAALAEIEGSFEGALRSSERLLGALGSVIPASPQHCRLHAEVDGAHIEGQVEVQSSRGDISRMWLEPVSAEVSESAVAAVVEADQIVLGPGSLYTSVIAAMLVPGLTEAINASSAQLVYVANLITQDGETLGMDAADHLDALLALTGVRPPSAIVANDARVEAKPPLEAVLADGDAISTYGGDLITADLVDRTAAWPSHDTSRLGRVLAGLISE
jgi:uncharacterized cofD-like protein